MIKEIIKGVDTLRHNSEQSERHRMGYGKTTYNQALDEAISIVKSQRPDTKEAFGVCVDAQVFLIDTIVEKLNNLKK